MLALAGGFRVAFLALTGISAVLQVLPAGDVATIEQISKIGVNCLLGLAVIILWRKYQEVTSLLMSSYKTSAEDRAAYRVVVEKMADTLERIEISVEKVLTVRSQITRETIEHHRKSQ